MYVVIDGHFTGKGKSLEFSTKQFTMQVSGTMSSQSLLQVQLLLRCMVQYCHNSPQRLATTETSVSICTNVFFTLHEKIDKVCMTGAR
jgi:hypothetical protein